MRKGIELFHNWVIFQFQCNRIAANHEHPLYIMLKYSIKISLDVVLGRMHEAHKY